LIQLFGYVSLTTSSLLIALRVYVLANPFSHHVLIEACSVAIWDMNKIVVGIAASLLVTHAAAMIQSKSFPLPTYMRECINDVALCQVPHG
jgi:hypothetical protein